jgi:hypothetical protein
MWEVDTKLSRFGYDDDEKATGPDAPDWSVWLVTRQYGMARHMHIQFPRPGIDRHEAEKIVQRALDGLNGNAPEQRAA